MGVSAGSGSSNIAKKPFPYGRLYHDRSSIRSESNVKWDRLFNSEINFHLLELERFQGVWRKLTKTSLGIFVQLLDYVPEELCRVLHRAALFWKEIESLCGSQDEILKDNETATRIEGLWPAWSSDEMHRIQQEMDDGILFPKVKDGSERSKICEKIQTLGYRVPTLGIIISEARAVNCMTDWLRSQGIELRCSAIYFDRGTERATD